MARPSCECVCVRYIVTTVDEGAATYSVATEHRAINGTMHTAVNALSMGSVRGWGLNNEVEAKEGSDCAHSHTHTHTNTQRLMHRRTTHKQGVGEMLSVYKDGQHVFTSSRCAKIKLKYPA